MNRRRRKNYLNNKKKNDRHMNLKTLPEKQDIKNINCRVGKKYKEGTKKIEIKEKKIVLTGGRKL